MRQIRLVLLALGNKAIIGTLRCVPAFLFAALLTIASCQPASAASPQVTLTWTASAGSPPASGYNVYRGQTSGTYPNGWSQINIGLVTSTSFIDTIGLQNGTWYYVVTAVNTDTTTCSTANCESGPSNQATAVVKLPNKPTISGVWQ
jgi:hypothetical protein